MKGEGPRKEVRKAAEALEAELLRLRTVLRDIADKYVADLEAEIVQLGETVAEMQGSMKDNGTLRMMAAEIRDLNLKPDKGRRKDLKRIDDLVDRLETMLRELE